MQRLETLARQARRRLLAIDVVENFPKYLLIYLSIAGIAIAISKLWPLGVHSQAWYFGWLSFAYFASAVHAVTRMMLRAPSLMQSAIEIDRRYGLKERLSSALALPADTAESPVSEALKVDAMKKAENVDLRDQFPVKMTKHAWWPFLPAACITVFWFAPDPINAAEIQAQQTAQATATQVKNATAPLLEQLRKKRIEAEDKGLTETADLFKQLENELEQMQKQGTLEKSEVLSKLNDFKEIMEERRKEVGTSENLQKNLDMLKDLADGPAEEMAKSMEKGDFDSAREQVEQLRDQLLKDQLTPEEKQKLTAQLEQMEKNLKEAAEKQQAKKKELEKKAEAARQAGDSQQAAEAQRELDKLESSAAQMESLQRIAEQLASAKESMKKGETGNAANELQELSEQLQELSEQAAESDELDQMLEEFEQSKDSMKCDQCQGEGCKECKNGSKSGDGSKAGSKSGSKGNKNGDQEGESSDGNGKSGKGKGGESEGLGMGEGQGAGDRPEKENDTDTYESQLRDKIQKGETIIGGKVGGPNKKGISREDVKKAVDNPELEDAQALESENLPRSRQDQTRDYFNNLRGGK